MDCLHPRAVQSSVTDPTNLPTSPPALASPPLLPPPPHRTSAPPLLPSAAQCFYHHVDILHGYELFAIASTATDDIEQHRAACSEIVHHIVTGVYAVYLGLA